MSSVKNNNNNNAVNAVIGGKTARACDSCITKRARWYCAADDAFLCQTCDSSVHSANSLARRHERLRLKTASFKSAANELQPNNNSAPTWHRGFTKKARTPRRGRNVNPFHLVPEAGSEEVNSQEENEEQLLYRVPIFDPFVAELCSTPSSFTSTDVEKKETVFGYNYNNHDFLPSDIELAEFAADVESLLGRGLENECVGMEDLGLIDNKDEQEDWECSVVVKVEDENTPRVDDSSELPCKVEDDGDIEIVGRDTNFDLSFDDYDESRRVELNDKVAELKENGKKKISLQLDYEAVIVAWDNQKSPWTTADKPNLDPDEYSMASYGTEIYNPFGGFGSHPVIGDGGREARVSRYREKRRTRLFSKKIRYEVRKLNAEKRPRMKGRFVKRASFAPPPTFPLLK